MLYWIGKAILWPLLATIFRPTVTGLEHIPPIGPAILVSNHLSVSDSFFLPVVVPRRVSFLAKSEYFTGRGVRGRLKAGFFRGVGQVPVDRSGGKAAEGAITALASVLGRGELVGIYPEGTRSPDGRLYRGKTGVARLTLRTGAPVIPVAMVGTDVVQPIGTSIPRVARVRVMIGAPMDFSRYAGMENDRFVLRSVTDEIMYELMRLSKQEYADMYASTMKERLAAAPVKARLAAATRGAVGGEDAVAAARAVADPAAVSDHGPAGAAPGGRHAPAPTDPAPTDPAPTDPAGAAAVTPSAAGAPVAGAGLPPADEGSPAVDAGLDPDGEPSREAGPAPPGSLAP